MMIKTENNAISHINYFDFLRLIGCFFVIFMHVASKPFMTSEIGSFKWEMLNIGLSLSFTAVPLFFMMSGYLIISSDKSANFNSNYFKRILKLLIPLIFWTIFTVIFDVLYFGKENYDAISIHRLFVSSLNRPIEVHLWFAYTLIAIYAISPILHLAFKNMDDKTKSIIFYVLLSIEVIKTLMIAIPNPYSNLLDIDLVNKILFFGGDLVCFVLGYLLGNMKKIKTRYLLIAFVVVLSLIVTATSLSSLSLRTACYDYFNQHYGPIILLAVLIFLIFKNIANKKTAFFEIFPIIPLLMGIYFSHIYLVYICNRYVYLPTGFLDTFLTSIIIFIASFVLSKIASSIIGLSYLFCGIRYKQACNTCNIQYTFKKIRAYFISHKKEKNPSSKI